MGHNKSHVMATEVFPLRPPGTPNVAMLVTFYPPWLDLSYNMLYSYAYTMYVYRKY